MHRYFVEGSEMDVRSFIEWWEHYGKPEQVEIVKAEGFVVTHGETISAEIKDAAVNALLDDTRIPLGQPEEWTVRMFCCGREDGTCGFPSWEAADAFRRSYAAAEGHERVGVIERAEGQCKHEWMTASKGGGPTIRRCRKCGSREIMP